MSAPLGHTMLALTTERHLVGKRYNKVPPHVSLLPWMSILNVRGDFINAAREICADTDELVLVPGESTTVGAPGFEKPALAIVCEQIVALHTRLFETAVEMGIVFSHPEYLGDSYMPHLTRSGLSLETKIPRLTVVDNIAPEGSSRGMKLVSENMPLRATA